MDEELLRKAIAVVEKNMDNVEFSTEQFAREMNMSRSNLHLKLKAITGKSAIDFIHKIRLSGMPVIERRKVYRFRNQFYGGI